MPLRRPATLACLLTALVMPPVMTPAWGQSTLGAPGSLPPPRPIAPPEAQPAAPRPSAAPPQRPAAQAPAQPRPAAQPQPAPRPARPSPPPQASRPAQPRPAPTLGQPQPPPSRRPGAAAAGAAAGVAAGAAAGAAAAPPRPAEPPAPPPIPAPTTGPVTGLPLPRFAALRSDEVNMRVGPNTTFPIEWTFQRRDLPVMIVGEFQLWRRIRDAEGAEGWVHSSTLAGRRTFLVRPPARAPEVPLRRRAEDGAAPVAVLRPGVIGRFRECETGNPWCEVQVAGHRGYIKRNEVWGIGEEEEIK